MADWKRGKGPTYLLTKIRMYADAGVQSTGRSKFCAFIDEANGTFF